MAEPTRQGVERVPAVAASTPAGYGVTGGGGWATRCTARGDVAFLREQAGDDLLAWLGALERAVRAMEQGRPFGLTDLSAQTRAALAVVHGTLDTRSRDWARYARQAAEFHRKNARAWASAATGQDLADQIDPGFTLGPRVVMANGAT